MKDYEEIRRGLGGTTDAERAQLKAELAEAERRLKAELDDPTPREAPERGRARRAAGRERDLPAEFGEMGTGTREGRTAQVIDVLTRAYQSRRRNISQPQLYREAQSLWMREDRPGRPPSLRQVEAFLKHDDMSQIMSALPRWGARRTQVFTSGREQ